jgi:PKD repeat protein
MLRTFFVAALWLISGTAFVAAQHPCGQHAADEALFSRYPAARAAAAAAELASSDGQSAPSYSRDEDEIYIIPVVFHVFHDDGVEDIDESQILDAISILNRDFRKVNADTSQIVAGFADLAGDAFIEFRLARRDPQGNCHRGVTRTQSDLTFEGSKEEMSNVIHWPRDGYMNIYVCNYAAGAAGYTNLPSNWGASSDGIVIRYDYVGSIGESSNYRSRTLTHEVGHWLNLRHVWGGTNNPALPENCDEDDGVSDTPLCEGSAVGVCDLDRSTCGSLDNVQNYMDYAYCPRMFTSGQGLRMRDALNSSVGDRNDLWTDANLQATGVLEEDMVCQAHFTPDATIICAGQSVVFTDESFWGVAHWAWNFGDGAEISGNDAEAFQHPEHVFETPGTYAVELTVTDAEGGQATTANSLITVLDQGVMGTAFTEGWEQASGADLGPDWSVVNPDDWWAWQVTSSTGFESNRSVRLNNRNNNELGELDDFISSTIDASALAEVVISYKYAFCQMYASDETDDRLKLYVSENCGENWHLREYHRGWTDLPTAPAQSSPFVPNDDQWVGHTEVVDNPDWMSGNFRIRFSFEARGGNNIFLDNINVYGIDTLGNVIGINELDMETSSTPKLSLYPNPARQSVEVLVDISRSQAVRVCAYDALGRLIEVLHEGTLPAGRQQLQWSGPAELSAGTYWISVETAGARQVLPLVVQPN